MRSDWYVYSHVRLDKNEPFYIGIGCKPNFARAFQLDHRRRNVIWKRIAEKTDVSVSILESNLTKDSASEKEQELIRKFGRIDLGMVIRLNTFEVGNIVS